MNRPMTEYFGCMVFNDAVMQQRLPADIYAAIRRTIADGRSLDPTVADAVATAMKEWALENGATHYTHWFQPLTGITAEKHDSFLSPDKEGNAILEFRGKELIRGESDASSFPSGGLRSTFEARGYTAWDATSYAFIKDGVLCIPTAFCSYGGEALDNKTPLLRSMEAINRQAMRVVRLFGYHDVTSVKTTVGAEQEYFLIDQKDYCQRPDLIYTGRTLFGAPAPKGQELDDHYFGVIRPRVAAFMKELDEELWRLGVFAKTEHNEGAPAQHELAPVFTTTNLATDQNQLVMEMMQKIARKHDLVCLLHEKPFEGVNGSGKHNNWSLSTNTGMNLLEPGETPYENAQFLLFLCAVLAAVDEYQDLLRISVASAGNDHRLGANEAPPAVVSVFLGDELSAVLDAIQSETAYSAKEKTMLRIGVHTLPKFRKDDTDRNRTSPFAFTGNKFEFRMLGASASIAEVNTTLNTAVAEILRRFADALEGAKDFEATLHTLIRDTIKNHKRILFNGNGYDDAWIAEAAKRGLSNLPSTPDALGTLLEQKNLDLFERHKVYSGVELRSRHEILLGNYSKIVHIEARTMLDMAHRLYLPAMMEYGRHIANAISQKKSACKSACCSYEAEMLERLNVLTDAAYKTTKKLQEAVEQTAAITDTAQKAAAYGARVLPLMRALRCDIDSAEAVTDASYWPVPSYGDLLFY